MCRSSWRSSWQGSPNPELLSSCIPVDSIHQGVRRCWSHRMPKIWWKSVVATTFSHMCLIDLNMLELFELWPRFFTYTRIYSYIYSYIYIYILCIYTTSYGQSWIRLRNNWAMVLNALSLGYTHYSAIACHRLPLWDGWFPCGCRYMTVLRVHSMRQAEYTAVKLQQKSREDTEMGMGQYL